MLEEFGNKADISPKFMPPVFADVVWGGHSTEKLYFSTERKNINK